MIETRLVRSPVAFVQIMRHQTIRAIFDDFRNRLSGFLHFHLFARKSEIIEGNNTTIEGID